MYITDKNLKATPLIMLESRQKIDDILQYNLYTINKNMIYRISQNLTVFYQKTRRELRLYYRGR